MLDTIAPTCITQDVTVSLDLNGDGSIDQGDVNGGITDSCGIESIIVIPNTFDCDDLGVVIVTVTATDINGNISICTAEVTVVDDIDPVCVAQDITVTLDGDGMITIDADQVDGGSSDNCDEITLSVNPAAFDCDDVGENEVVLTVTDGSGNTSTCTAIVTVEDPGGLFADCQNLTFFLDANGQVIVDPEDVDDGSGGGCDAGELTFELSETMFDCSETGANIVTLTVTDSEGNTATCTAIITILDNTPPVLICPPNMTVNCDDPIDIEDLSQFGNPTTSDNCPPVTLVEVVEDNRDDCGQGTIVRNFTATDPSGNSSECSQTIVINDSDPFDETDIIWPPGIVNLGPCSSTDPGPGNQPIIDAGSCANISVDYEDDITVTIDNDPLTPCVEIIRDWTVIDSCQLEPGTENGIFTFTQMIILNDNVGPVFTPLNDVTVTADEETCVAFVSLITTATDCGESTPITNDYNGGGGNASDEFPVGTTTIIFTSTDDCGNISTMDVNVTVLDPNPANFECHKIIRHMTEEFEVCALAVEFVTFSPGSCTTIEDFLFSYSPTDPLDSFMCWGCQFAGSVEPVMIYAFDLNGFPVDTCRGDLDLRDTADLCGQMLVVTGQIYGETHHMIEDVAVLISDPSMQSEFTEENGRYAFRDLSPGGMYTITPYRNVDHKYGVSTLDLVAIQKHLLGIRQLDSPYKLIAADVNNTGTISVLDLIELRRLLLNYIPEFTNNTSWRFVDAHYDFPDPQNPWVVDFPEKMSFEPLMQHLTHQDFIGIKIGDVNNTVFLLQPGDIDTRSSGALILDIEDQIITAGQEVHIPFRVRGYDQLLGYQFALRFNTELARFKDLIISPDSKLDKEWFGLNSVEQGLISSLWYEPQPVALQDGELLFTLSFTARQAFSLSELFALDHQAMSAEAYGANEEIRPIELSLDNPVELVPEFEVFQNVPNPFTEGTILPVQLPNEGVVVLEIYSFDGRLVHRQTEYVEEGYHEFHVTKQQLQQGGIYYYTIATDRFSGTRKMTMLE